MRTLYSLCRGFTLATLCVGALQAQVPVSSVHANDAIRVRSADNHPGAVDEGLVQWARHDSVGMLASDGSERLIALRQIPAAWIHRRPPGAENRTLLRSILGGAVGAAAGFAFAVRSECYRSNRPLPPGTFDLSCDTIEPSQRPLFAFEGIAVGAAVGLITSLVVERARWLALQLR
jgi:hypothetical protein